MRHDAAAAGRQGNRPAVAVQAGAAPGVVENDLARAVAGLHNVGRCAGRGGGGGRGAGDVPGLGGVAYRYRAGGSGLDLGELALLRFTPLPALFPRLIGIVGSDERRTTPPAAGLTPCL